MCPDHKLKCFQDHSYDLQQIKSIRGLVCDYRENVYAGEEENEPREEENRVIGKNIFQFLLMNLIFSQSNHNMPQNKISLSRTTFQLTLMNPGSNRNNQGNWRL